MLLNPNKRKFSYTESPGLSNFQMVSCACIKCGSGLQATDYLVHPL
jgi:hypothetical protein